MEREPEKFSQYIEWATGWTTGILFSGGATMGILLFANASNWLLDPTSPTRLLPLW